MNYLDRLKRMRQGLAFGVSATFGNTCAVERRLGICVMGRDEQ